MLIEIGNKTIVIHNRQVDRLFTEVREWLIDHKIDFQIVDNNKG